jgi:predicted GIY-YIG superfamily endonuclease
VRVERLQQHLGISKREAKALLAEVDHDGDGWVSFQEVNDWITLHSVGPIREDPEPTTVYIARDANGVVLYIGITGRNIRRMHAHSKASEWWPAAVSIELLHQPNREIAEARERQLIRELRPAFNVVYAERVFG